MRRTIHILCLAALLGAADAGAGEPFFRDLAPIADDTLAEMRGGFVLPGGGVLALGVDSGVRINGELAAHMQWENGQVRITRSGAMLDGLSVSALDEHAMAAGRSLGWIVQNQLDEIQIHSFTEFHVDLQGMRGISTIHRDRMLEAQAVTQLAR